jgi:hypothetical protein
MLLLLLLAMVGKNDKKADPVSSECRLKGKSHACQ